MELSSMAESTLAPSSPWLLSLHYAFPIIVFAYYITSSTIAICTLQTSHVKKQPSRRTGIVLLMFFAALTFFIQFLLILIESYINSIWLGQQDQIVGLLSCILVFGLELAGLMTTEDPVWHPYIGSCMMALVFDPVIAVFSLLAHTPGSSNIVHFLDLSAVAGRSMAFVVVVIIYVSWKNENSRDSGSDPERQPLLQKGVVDDSEETLTGTATEYGSNEESTTEGSETSTEARGTAETPWERREREAKEHIHKRLKETGNWFTYTKKFMIFFPYIWPVNDRLLQARFVLVGLCLLAGNALNILIPRQLGRVTDTLSDVAQNDSSTRNIWIELLVFAGLTLSASSAGISLLRQWLWIPVQYYSSRALSTAAYSHILNLSSDFHDSKNSSDLMVAISSASGVSDLLESVAFAAIPNLIDITVAFVYLSLTFGPYEGFITFATAIIFLYIATYIMARLKEARRKEISAYFEEHYIQQAGFQGWTTVTCFNQIPYEERRYSAAVQDRVSKAQTLQIGFLVAQAFQYLVLLAGLLAGCFLAVYQVVNGQASPGQFVMLLTLWAQLGGPLRFFATLGREVWRNLIAAERLLDVMQTTPTVVNKENALPFKFAGGLVEFNNVNFSYDSKKPILKDISLSIPSGTTVAFVGATGAGKSTILKLLDRFYDATEGSIKIDRQDIRDVDIYSLRAQIGVVPQTPILFDDTIMNNVRYAKLDASDEDVFEACKAAAIHNQILGFTDGYNTRVGERGMKLSGGELQRLAIARAILKRPSIVLLDEATSSVDTETESQIQDALRTLCKGRTTFVVAHRLSTIVNSDLIVVVSNGKVIEQGSHDDLIIADGKYAELWSKQIFVKPKERTPTKERPGRKAQRGPNIVDHLISQDVNSELATAIPAARLDTSGTSTTGVAHQPTEMKTPAGHKREGSKLNPDAPEFTPRSLLAAAGSMMTPTSKSKAEIHDPFQPAPIVPTTATPVKIPCYADPPVVLLPSTGHDPLSDTTNRRSIVEQTISEESQESSRASSVAAPQYEANTRNKNNRKLSFKYPRFSRRDQSKSEPSSSNRNSTEGA